MDNIRAKFNHARYTPSDINEHMITLWELSTQCETILECGVRSVVSSWAFALGLLENNSSVKNLTGSDIVRSPNIDELQLLTTNAGIKYDFVEGSDLVTDLPHADMIFIDTWHVYGQLKRELARFASMAGKFIVMHDTTVDAEQGETIRMGMNLEVQMKESGYPREEILRGLWPAVEEFLETHPEWTLRHRYTHNNGLTVLERVSASSLSEEHNPPVEKIPGPDGSFIQSIGKGTYGVEHIHAHNWGEPTVIRIGAFCSISADIHIFLGGNHRTEWITTFPFGHTSQDRYGGHPVEGHPVTNGNVTIGNDVWIGWGVTIMSGVTVGDGAVLAAGSMVTKDVAPYSIVAGNPAQQIKFRFSLTQIQALERIAWWNWSDDKIKAEVSTLCSANLDSFLQKHDPASKKEY